MAPHPLPWMKPGDLILFDLELLPWPAYLRLVEAYFGVRYTALEPLHSHANRAEFLLHQAGEPEALLHCMQRRHPVALGDLTGLVAEMASTGLRRGFLFSPGTIDSAVYLRAGDANVELYSGNKLRVRIDSLRADQRRQVMDAISARPQRLADGGVETIPR